jgi:hypothetical protein
MPPAPTSPGLRKRRIAGFALLVCCLIALAVALNQSSDAPPMEVRPDADGKLTFHGPGYRFRVWPKQVALMVSTESRSGPTVVELSVDRREFGAPEAPGEASVTCRPDGSCSDSCSDGRPCYDIRNGWYRVNVLPASQSWGHDPHELNLGPRVGAGFRCADAKRPGLELCWDPVRIGRLREDPLGPVTDTRSVSYPAIRDASALVWVSTAHDANGRPTFVADCAGEQCRRNIERDGARLEITFSVQELDNWQRFDARLHEFAARLIEPVADETSHDRQ